MSNKKETISPEMIRERVQEQFALLDIKGEFNDYYRLPYDWRREDNNISENTKEGYYKPLKFEKEDVVFGLFGNGVGARAMVQPPTRSELMPFGMRSISLKKLEDENVYSIILDGSTGNYFRLEGYRYRLWNSIMVLNEYEEWKYEKFIDGVAFFTDEGHKFYKFEEKNQDGFYIFNVEGEEYIVSPTYVESKGEREYWEEVAFLENLHSQSDSLFITSNGVYKKYGDNSSAYLDVSVIGTPINKIINHENYIYTPNKSREFITGVDISSVSFRAKEDASSGLPLEVYGKKIFKVEVGDRFATPPKVKFNINWNEKVLNTERGKSYFIELPHSSSLAFLGFEAEKETMEVYDDFSTRINNPYPQNPGLEGVDWLVREHLSQKELIKQIRKLPPVPQEEEFGVIIQQGKDGHFLLGVNTNEDIEERALFIATEQSGSLKIIDYVPLFKGVNTYTTILKRDRVGNKNLLIGTTKGELVRYHSYYVDWNGEVKRNLTKPNQNFVIESELEYVEFEIYKLTEEGEELFAYGNTGEEKRKEIAPLETNNNYLIKWSKKGYQNAEQEISGERGRVLLKLEEVPTCTRFVVNLNVEDVRVEIYSLPENEYFAGGRSKGKQIIFKRLEHEKLYRITAEKFGYKYFEQEIEGDEYNCSMEINLLEDPHCEFLNVISETEGALVRIYDEEDFLIERGLIVEGKYVAKPLINGKRYRISLSKNGYFSDEVEMIGAYDNCSIELNLKENPNAEVPEGTDFATEEQLYKGLDENLEMAKQYTNMKLKEFDSYLGFGYVGAYSDYVQYSKNNIVEYKGSAYILRDVSNAGNPDEDVAWALFTKGIDEEQWYTPVGSVNGIYPDEEGNLELGEILKLEDLDEVRKAVERDTKAYTDLRIEEVINMGNGNSPSLDDYMSVMGGVFEGEVSSSPEVNSINTGRFRNIYLGEELPDDEIGNEGDIFFVYEHPGERVGEDEEETN